MWRLGFKPLVPQRATALLEQTPQSNSTTEISSIISKNFAHEICLDDRLRSLSRRASTSRRAIRQQHWQTIDSGLHAYASEQIDRILASYSVEYRHPFFDRRVVELSLALPLEQKLQRGWTRAILREAMKDLLPPEVRWRRPKGNLSANFLCGLLDEGRTTLEEGLLNVPKVLSKYVDVPELQKMYDRFKSEPLQHEHEALTLSSVSMLSLWLRHTNLTVG